MRENEHPTQPSVQPQPRTRFRYAKMFRSRVSSARTGQDDELNIVDSWYALKAISSKHVKQNGYSITHINKCLLEDDNVYVALSRIFGDTSFVVVFNSKDGEVVINHVDQRTK